VTRLTRAWGALDREQRLAGGAALALFVTMFLPWYQQNAVITGSRNAPLVSQNLSAFAVFSFIEAAVLLVAAATLVLLFLRAERRSFHLPGGDGTIVLLAGAWAAFLLILRLFDKPGITSHGIAANVGIQWGIFFALGAAGLMIYAGSRMRAAQRPEAPVLREPPREPPPREPQPQEPQELWPREPQQGEPPEWEGEPREAPPAPPQLPEEREPATTVLARSAGDGSGEGPAAVPARPRPRYPPAPGSPAPSTAGGRALARRRRSAPDAGEQLPLDALGDDERPERA